MEYYPRVTEYTQCGITSPAADVKSYESLQEEEAAWCEEAPGAWDWEAAMVHAAVSASVWVAATAAAPYLGPACRVAIFIHHSIFIQSPLAVMLAPGFKCCSHKAMNKKDIGFNGLTKREESFKKKQNKRITTMASYMAFSLEGFSRLT